MYDNKGSKYMMLKLIEMKAEIEIRNYSQRFQYPSLRVASKRQRSSKDREDFAWLSM